MYTKLADGRISGRDQHLVFLSRYVEIATGDPHHGEIADLVNAMRQRGDPNSKKIETSENIRKRVDRHSPNVIVEIELAWMQAEGSLKKARK
jgi:hypothetical protein